MARLPTPLCGWQEGTDFVDSETLDLTKSHAPAHRHAEPSSQAHHASKHHKHHESPPVRTAYNGVENQLLVNLVQEGVTDPTEQAMFLAQVSHESGDFKHLKENLHYSASTLLRLFPNKVKDEADAKAVAAGGEAAVAERIYGHRVKDLGNSQDGDGARYRGRGYMQLTGRKNYEAAGKYLNLPLLTRPELVETPDVAAKTAVWYWITRTGLSAAGRRGDVKRATKLINGGYVGLEDRKARFLEYLQLYQVTHQNNPVETTTPN